MSLYCDAAAGSLTPTALKEYILAGSVDEPSTEDNETLGYTALALAARGGHLESAQLLLELGARADALCSDNCTPLWLVTARGRGKERAAIVDLLLQHNANAQYSHPDLQGGSTPLENELRQVRDLEVIRLLVKADGVNESAMKLAIGLKNSKIREAMMSSMEKKQIRNNIVKTILAVVLYIVFWVNTIGEVTNAILRRFGIIGKPNIGIQKEIPDPKTEAEFKANINCFVRKHRLENFFSTEDGNPFLETLVSKAVALAKKDSPAGRPAVQPNDLVKLGLYQPIIYCDDSGSMNEKLRKQPDVTRLRVQGELVERVASVCTRLVPDDLGVHLRFINTKLKNADNLQMDAIRDHVSHVNAKGSTEIGTNLRKQILNPLVYGGEISRPLFVSIITDGIPSGPKGTPERIDTLKREIVECHKYLRQKGLSERSVVFQLSQIGDDKESENFLSDLNADQSLHDILYVTRHSLDSRYTEFKKNEDDLEAWLVQTLLEPFLESQSES